MAVFTLATRPVPDNAAVVDPPLLLVMPTVAVDAPAAVGVNAMGTVVDAPAASVVVDGEPAVNCDEPVMVNGVTSVTSNVLVFVMVSDELPDDPTVTMAKLTLVGDAVIVAETMPME